MGDIGIFYHPDSGLQSSFFICWRKDCLVHAVTEGMALECPGFVSTRSLNSYPCVVVRFAHIGYHEPHPQTAVVSFHM